MNLDIRIIDGKKYQLVPVDEVTDKANIEKDIAKLEEEIQKMRAIITAIEGAK